MDGNGLTTLTLITARTVLADASGPLRNKSRCYGGSSVWVAGWERGGVFGGRTVRCGEALVGNGEGDWLCTGSSVQTDDGLTGQVRIHA